MKLTKTKLKQLIKEELNKALLLEDSGWSCGQNTAFVKPTERAITALIELTGIFEGKWEGKKDLGDLPHEELAKDLHLCAQANPKLYKAAYAALEMLQEAYADDLKNQMGDHIFDEFPEINVKPKPDHDFAPKAAHWKGN